jgi:hypothetical protein
LERVISRCAASDKSCAGGQQDVLIAVCRRPSGISVNYAFGSPLERQRLPVHFVGRRTSIEALAGDARRGGEALDVLDPGRSLPELGRDERDDGDGKQGDDGNPELGQREE